MINRLKQLLPILAMTTSLVLVLTCSSAWAAKDVEIGGLIIDQTRTKIGHDFYESFNLLWQTSPAENFNIVVDDEYINPRSGTTVLVEVNSSLVYQSRLRSKPDDIEATAMEAFEAARIFIANLKGKYETDLKEQ